MERTPQQTVDDLFDALSNVQRRRILVDLLEHNPQSVAELPGTSAPHPAPHKEAFARHHVHLPKLEDYGFIKWDRDAGEVVKGPKFETIRPVVEYLHERREQSPEEWV